jgi:S-adenosylmethionine-diacylglycerol 3-amino-3-carboxypropyl transferase
VSELLAGKSIQEQCLFYRRKWNNLRFRFFFNLFFSRKVMARHGRDPAFFAYVEGGIVRRLRKRAEYALTEISTYSNPYLHFILRGNFAPEALPHYLRKENFEKIKANINKIVCFQGSIRQAVDFFGQRKFDAFNLSDVFEYMSRNEFASVLRGIEACATKGARIAYWDLFAGRQLSALGSRFVWDRARAEELFKRNKAFFYDSLVVGIKQD